MEVLAIKNTGTHCKGVVYYLPEEEAIEGIAGGLFVNKVLNNLMNVDAEKPAQQETYHADGSDKEVTKSTKK
jgi:cation transport regulator ChaC